MGGGGNQTEIIKAEICVIGAGSGGLSVAAGAAQMGASTVLIEKGPMGGDCLNTGCVPSKALLAAAHRAQTLRDGARFGVSAADVSVDFSAVHAHVHRTIAAIAPHDSVERFTGLGVRVIKGTGQFTSPREVAVGNLRIRSRRFVVATGSSPFVPAVEGLAEAPFLTNETVFDLREAPGCLLVLGGGPIGIEMAQAFRRLGSEVIVVEMASILPKDDPDLAAVVRDRLVDEGIRIFENSRALGVRHSGGDIIVTVEHEGRREDLAATHLLVAAGRKANTDGLGLAAAGIDFTAGGITVDERLRTTNKKVFAIGDVIGKGPYGAQFTHVAGYHAGIVIRNALFRMPARVDLSVLPWVTYSDPELAQVGLTQAEAVARHGESRVTVLRRDFSENDRARAEGETQGFLKIMVGPRGRILGASMVGAQAGELIQPIILAMASGLKIASLASFIAPYPTRGEMVKHAAGSFFTPRLFSPFTKHLVRFLSYFG